MSTERDSERVTLRCKIKYGTTQMLNNLALSSDVSATGLRIKTNNVFEKGTLLRLRIETQGKSYLAEGEVMWSKVVPRGLDRVVKNGMGIRFTEIDPAFVELCNASTNHNSESKDSTDRKETDETS